MIRSYQILFNRIFIAIDTITIIISLLLAWWLKFESGIFTSEAHLPLIAYFKPLVIVIPFLLFLNYLFQLYSPRRSKYFYGEFWLIIKSNLIGIFFIMSILFFIKQIHYSRVVLLLFISINIFFMTAERLALRKFLRYIRRQGFNKKFLLIIGAGSIGQDFAKKVKDNRDFGYEVVGFLDDDSKKLSKKIDGIKVLGDINSLVNVISRIHVDEVIIALPIIAYNRLKTIIQTCEKIGLKAQIIPDYFDYIPAKPEVDDFDGIPLVNIRQVPLDNILNYILKRAFDIFISLIGLIMISPLLLLIAIGIKLSSPGSIVFKQERVGLHRKPFTMYKFRTMKVLNEKVSDTVWTTENDPRKTKFGSFLRKTSLDELPQLFNVLNGDMSLIGPRPERPFFVDKFKEEIPKYMIKHHVRPGITGWAQVNGWRGDTSIAERIKYDLYYVENWTFLLDIKILWMTLYKGLINKNAY